MKSPLLVKMKDEMTRAMIGEKNLRKEGTTDGKVFESLVSVKYVVRSVLSMFPDEDIKPENATDDDTINMIKKFIYKEATSELYVQGFLTESDVVGLSPKELTALTKQKIYDLSDDLFSMNMGVAATYLPKKATEEEIREWIFTNIDFSKLNNKMQAMKPVLEQFKSADGLMVKNIIMSLP